MDRIGGCCIDWGWIGVCCIVWAGINIKGKCGSCVPVILGGGDWKGPTAVGGWAGWPCWSFKGWISSLMAVFRALSTGSSAKFESGNSFLAACFLLLVLEMWRCFVELSPCSKWATLPLKAFNSLFSFVTAEESFEFSFSRRLTSLRQEHGKPFCISTWVFGSVLIFLDGCAFFCGDISKLFRFASLLERHSGNWRPGDFVFLCCLVGNKYKSKSELCEAMSVSQVL